MCENIIFFVHLFLFIAIILCRKIFIGSDDLINLYALALIFLSNLIIYLYNLDNFMSIFFGTIFSTFFEYGLIFSIRKKFKTYGYVQCFLFVLTAFLKIALSIYFKHFGDFLMLARVKQARHLGGVTNFIYAELFSPVYIAIFLLATIGCYICLKGLGYYNIRKKIKHIEKYTLISTGCLFVIMSISNVFSSANEMYSMATKSIFNLNSITHAASNEDFSKMSSVLFRNYKHKNKFTGLGKGKNLLVIQVESLQKAFMHKKIKGQEITPYLNKLADSKGTIYLNNYHELLGFGNTSDAEYVSMTSMYPNTIDSSYVTYKDTKTFGLPFIANKMGYDVVSMHGFTGKFYDRDVYHSTIGFKKSYFGEDYDQNEILGMGLSDGSFFRQSLPILKNLDQKGPYFSFMITLTSHVPYDMPEEYRVFRTKESAYENSGVYKYMDSIHYFDKVLGEFLEDMRSQGFLDNTVVAIYGDHYAIEINDKEEKKDMSEFLGHEYYYDDMQNIPLIILVPGLEENIQSNSLGSQVDFLPTILNIMSWNEEVIPMFGVDLLDENLSKDNVVYPQTHMLKGSYYQGDVIFEKSRTPGDQGGYLVKNNKKIKLDQPDDTSLYGIKLIDFSNYLCENNLLEDEINKFKK